MVTVKDILYRITPIDLAAHLFAIEIHLTQPDPRGQIISLPAWIPGSYMIRDFARQIQNLNVKQEKITIEKVTAKTDTVRQATITTPDYFKIEEHTRKPESQINEEYAKKLIREKKFAQAIAILNELNLIYPKKSIYFADQIRFLEKILVITKKLT